MKTYLKLATAIVAATASINASAQIDLFTSPVGQTRVQDSATGPGFDPSTGLPLTTFLESSDAADPGSILGGYRDMEVNYVSGGGQVSMVVDSTNNSLSFNNDTSTVGTGTVQWDGNDNSAALDTTGLGGIDFTTLGSSFAFEVLAADQGFDFSIGLYDMAGNFTVFDLLSNAGPHTQNIAFSFFDNAQGDGLCGSTNFMTSAGLVNSVTCSGDLDLTNIGAMEVKFNTGTPATIAVDLAIGPIHTVPEASTIALIGLGLIGSGFASRKSRKK